MSLKPPDHRRSRAEPGGTHSQAGAWEREEARTLSDKPAVPPIARSLLPYAAILLLLHTAIGWLSLHFAYDRPLREQPIMAFVTLYLIEGGVFVCAVLRLLPTASFTGWTFRFMLMVGLGMRACMMFSHPILEYDFYRYLWDGAVLAEGMNPYSYSPEQIVSGAPCILSALTALAAQSGEVIHRISFPELRTIYPPVSQLGFAAAYLISPWSLTAWRAVLALCDVATLLLVLAVLKSLGSPRSYSLIYWWNPLVIFEIYNPAHMDVIALPFAVAAILLAARTKHLAAAASLALAVGAKLWPVVLLPWVLCGVWRRPGRLAAVLGVFSVVTAILAVPVLLAGLDLSSGFVAYSREWEMNDCVFRLVRGGIGEAVSLFACDSARVPLLARFACGAMLIVLIGIMLKKRGCDGPDLWDGALVSATGLFLLSPTAFPWYYLWVVPFLAVRPRVSLLLLNWLLMVYYLVYWCRAVGAADLFDGWVVWWEYVPFWIVLCLELWRLKPAAEGGR